MTINVGLVTSEALVLGCDSIASVTSYRVDPFASIQKDRSGKPKVDKSGRFTLKFELADVQEIVTDAWGGVTKMFAINPAPSPVVAVTAGLAKLRDRPISSFGEEFAYEQKINGKILNSVEDAAKAFLAFLKKHYDANYAKSSLPPQFRDGPEFLVGGFGANDEFPSLYRVKVKENRIRTEFAPGKAGVSWNGQADAVERFIRGYDGPLRRDIEQHIADEFGDYHGVVAARAADIINSVLTALAVPMPAGIDVAIPPPAKMTLPWRDYRVSIGYGNLPLQEAINSVSFLVNLQAGKARFAHGVATVGGRVHIGYITKGKDLVMLNEPELQHRYTGFGDGF